MAGGIAGAAGPARRGVVRLIVPSPDGRRVLARPNGLAGWQLPSIPCATPLESWTPEASQRAAALLGARVEPVSHLRPDAWVVEARGRISPAGNTWIAVGDAARLGADASLVRRWAERAPDGPDRAREADR
jgi:hypothetical protein